MVVFLSGGTNLVPGQIDATGDDFFLFERATGEVSLVKPPPGQEETTAGTTAAAAAISDDGRFVVLALAGDLGGGYGSFHVLDRQGGFLAPLPPSPDSGSWYGVDVDARGDFVALLSSAYPTGNVQLHERATGSFTLAGSGASYPPAISADGRFVVNLGKR